MEPPHAERSPERNTTACAAPAGAGYGLGFVGALVYYLVHAESLGGGLLGVLKALFWPGVLVYELLTHVGA